MQREAEKEYVDFIGWQAGSCRQEPALFSWEPPW